MRRDRNRDYATDAFQFYAAVGGYEKYSKALHEQLTKEVAEYYQRSEVPAGDTMPVDPQAAAQARYTKLAALYEPDMLDLKAVDETIELMEMRLWHKTRVAAVRHVYQKEPNIQLSGEILMDFVYAASREIFASPSSIYDWLYDARAIFAWKRKLRLTAGQENRLRRLHLV